MKSTTRYFALAVSVCLSVGQLFAVETATGDCLWMQDYLTPVTDFPKPGIMFRSYANLLKDPEAFHLAIKTFAERYKDAGLNGIVGVDSSGFIFGAALAYELKVPFVMVRRPGKLPRKVERIDCGLQHGNASSEMDAELLPEERDEEEFDDVLDTGAVTELEESPEAEVLFDCSEFGNESFEIEVDSLLVGERVVVIDDVVATGGTASAVAELVERLGAEVVEVACLFELSALHGREKIARPVYSLIAIDNPDDDD